jgi:hypothetical protein
MLGHLVGEHGRDQVGSGGEPPVDSGVADPGLAGHLVQGHVEALFGEDGACRVHHGVAVAGGINTERHVLDNAI